MLTFQSVFPKYFLMKGTHPLLEPDECPVCLSSWTPQVAGEGGRCPSITWAKKKGNYSGKSGSKTLCWHFAEPRRCQQHR